MKNQFQVISPYQPQGDQPQAIDKLTANLSAGQPFQTLLGATGTGKTFTMAHVTARLNKPTLVISHNKTLAAQLYEEFKELFPENGVCYFVSYYDYYQPEAYIPQRDIYIEKDSSRNDDLDRLRLYATRRSSSSTPPCTTSCRRASSKARSRGSRPSWTSACSSSAARASCSKRSGCSPAPSTTSR